MFSERGREPLKNPVFIRKKERKKKVRSAGSAGVRGKDGVGGLALLDKKRGKGSAGEVSGWQLCRSWEGGWTDTKTRFVPKGVERRL